jgi:hypothetical protein
VCKHVRVRATLHGHVSHAEYMLRNKGRRLGLTSHRHDIDLVLERLRIKVGMVTHQRLDGHFFIRFIVFVSQPAYRKRPSVVTGAVKSCVSVEQEEEIVLSKIWEWLRCAPTMR